MLVRRSTPPPRRWPAPRSATGSAGTRINLERSLKIGDELGGHIVTGHVDGVADDRRPRGDHGRRRPVGATARFDIKAPASLARFIAEKGSVCLDGTSLTVNTVEGDVFSVLLIPHTLAVTTWGERQAGDKLNLEVDLMARYAARLAEAAARAREAVLTHRTAASRRGPPVHLEGGALSECRDDPSRRACGSPQDEVLPSRAGRFMARNARQNHCPPARAGSAHPHRRGALLR